MAARARLGSACGVRRIRRGFGNAAVFPPCGSGAVSPLAVLARISARRHGGRRFFPARGGAFSQKGARGLRNLPLLFRGGLFGVLRNYFDIVGVWAVKTF